MLAAKRLLYCSALGMMLGHASGCVLGHEPDGSAAEDLETDVVGNQNPGAPIGFLDGMALDNGGRSVRLSGWTCDPNAPGSHLQVTSSLGGSLDFQTSIANLPREQAVANLCGGYPNHGFSVYVSCADLDVARFFLDPPFTLFVKARGADSHSRTVFLPATGPLGSVWSVSDGSGGYVCVHQPPFDSRT